VNSFYDYALYLKTEKKQFKEAEEIIQRGLEENPKATRLRQLLLGITSSNAPGRIDNSNVEKDKVLKPNGHYDSSPPPPNRRSPQVILHFNMNEFNTLN
jgi:hypothetical protein